MTETMEKDNVGGAVPPVAGAQVKGWRNGLLLIVPTTGTWDEVIEQVHVRLDEAKARSFWRGAQTTIDCQTRPVSLDEMTALIDRIKRGFGLVPIAVVSPDAATRAAAEKLALTTYSEMPVVQKAAPPVGDKPNEKAAAPPAPGASPGNNALYLPGTVRSGQRVVHDGTIIVCGDVNAGAEVMAGGDILVFGTLRGLAHAGCYGDKAARIVANGLKPPQLRIADKIARAPEEALKAASRAYAPEVARIEDGEIGVFPL